MDYELVQTFMGYEIRKPNGKFFYMSKKFTKENIHGAAIIYTQKNLV